MENTAQDTTQIVHSIGTLIVQKVIEKGEQPYMAYSYDDKQVKSLLDTMTDLAVKQAVESLNLAELAESARDYAFTQLSAETTPVEKPEASTSIVKPAYWDDLVQYLTPGVARPAIALVGPAGNGKTTAAESVCESLKYEYVVIDATEYLEPADLVGAMTYHPEKGEVWKDGKVTKAFREGKAIIINEFDALNPRAALCLQSVCQDKGLNGKGRYVTTPGAESDRVYPNGDCPLIVTMNTYGTGATRQYVGRNALDAATADRFTIISTGYENEAAILRSHGYSLANAQKLETWAKSMRQRIDENALRVILSLRTLLRTAQAIETYGQEFDTAVLKEFMNRLEPEVRELLANKPAPTAAPVSANRPFGRKLGS